MSVSRTVSCSAFLCAGLALVALLTSGCYSRAGLSSEISCSAKPLFEHTADWLTTCLPARASPGDIERTLSAWGRIGTGWGGVSQADVLPGGEQEMIVRYHADLANAAWNPQGKLLVLQREARYWRLVFDASSIGIRAADGTRWDNWSYRVLETADVTGDGCDDLLVELLYSNGLHAVMQYDTLLTAHPGDRHTTLHVAFLEKTTLTRPSYLVVDMGNGKAIQAVVSVADRTAITRTLSFTGDSLEVVDEAVDPGASTSSATTSDGSRWVAFDQFDGAGGSFLYSPHLGLYRMREGHISHLDIPATIRALRVAPDGSLYVVAGFGILRYSQEKWQTLLRLEGAPRIFPQPFSPFDIAFAPNGDLWVGGVYSLAYFDGKTWTQYGVPARRLLVAPDGSVWADGWDGLADSDCCFTHVTGSTWVTYTHSAPLPVSDDLLVDIYAMRR